MSAALHGLWAALGEAYPSIVIEKVDLTAPDGPVVAVIRPRSSWPWWIAALGAVIVGAGGILLGHSSGEPAVKPSTSLSSSQR